MKASDKICVAPHQIFDYDLDIQEVGHNGAEEYIRKEALLEWLEYEREWFEGTDIEPHYQKVIEHINEM